MVTSVVAKRYVYRICETRCMKRENSLLNGAHAKRKCKTLKETEFFPRSRDPLGLENSVSVARFLKMSHYFY